jgi:hypothetical protein
MIRLHRCKDPPECIYNFRIGGLDNIVGENMILKLFLGQEIVDLTGRDFPAAEGIPIDDQNLELAGRG